MVQEVNEITISIPASQAAQLHIEGLQSTLTKRNAEIARLTARLEEALTGEPNQSALQDAYRRGWKEAGNHLLTSTHAAAMALGQVRKDAMAVYFDSAKEAAE